MKNLKSPLRISKWYSFSVTVCLTDTRSRKFRLNNMQNIVMHHRCSKGERFLIRCHNNVVIMWNQRIGKWLSAYQNIYLVDCEVFYQTLLQSAACWTLYALQYTYMFISVLSTLDILLLCITLCSGLLFATEVPNIFASKIYCKHLSHTLVVAFCTKRRKVVGQ